jgi:hypothetical protein
MKQLLCIASIAGLLLPLLVPRDAAAQAAPAPAAPGGGAAGAAPGVGGAVVQPSAPAQAPQPGTTYVPTTPGAWGIRRRPTEPSAGGTRPSRALTR